VLDPPPSPQQRKRVGAPFGSADEIEEAFLLASGRRDFLNWFLGSAFGTLVLWILYPVARFVSTPAIPESTAAQVEAGATNDPAFQQTGYKIVRFGEEPIIVMRVDDDDFRAFSAT
jgi:hypothetical protein